MLVNPNQTQSNVADFVCSVCLSDKIGKEVISRFRIPFYKNNQTFYTDSNGREMLKRILNYRPSFTLRENVENVTGNYYPITSRISLTDQQTRFSVLNDRSQGGSSLQDGEIELMVPTYNILNFVSEYILLRRHYNDFNDFILRYIEGYSSTMPLALTKRWMRPLLEWAW